MSKLPEMTVYYNQPMGIRLAVPVGWSGKTLDKLAFNLFGLPEPKYNNFRATLNVEKLDLEEDADGDEVVYGGEMMSELIAQSQEDLKSEMDGFHSLREERYTSADGLPAYSHWFYWQNPETGMAHAQVQALLLTAEGALYIFNGSSVKALESQYIPIFDHIIRSARISA